MRMRAAKGGQVIGGKAFKGGQFVPEKYIRIQMQMDGKKMPPEQFPKALQRRLDRVIKRIDPRKEKSLSRASFLIRRAAQSLFRSSRKASSPGRPPHTRPGRRRLPRAILYAVDRQREEAVIGPAAHLVGKAGKPHEHGGKFMGQTFPERPFMGPALEAMSDQIPRQFTGLLGPTL